jgi:hypothetical protein
VTVVIQVRVSGLAKDSVTGSPVVWKVSIAGRSADLDRAFEAQAIATPWPASPSNARHP